jgi:tetratricopeptide (TPR) repeat protein
LAIKCLLSRNKIQKTRFMKKILMLVLLLAVGRADAQITTPQSSAPGSVSTTVGLTEIKVDYFRPKVRGRKIFGNDAAVLVPNGKIWRTGANSGTKISFGDDVEVEGIKVPKGEYLIFSWPGAAEWTIALYKDVKLGGNTDAYDKAQEAANFKVKPEKLTEKVETFTVNIGDISEDNRSAKVQLAWENTSVKFGVKVDFDEKVMKSIESATRSGANSYFQAAVYYLENGKDLNKALEYINVAAANNPNAFWILHQKAKIQKALGDKKGARETATASLEGAKKANNRDYQMMNEELIKSMK